MMGFSPVQISYRMFIMQPSWHIFFKINPLNFRTKRNYFLKISTLALTSKLNTHHPKFKLYFLAMWFYSFQFHFLKKTSGQSAVKFNRLKLFLPSLNKSAVSPLTFQFFFLSTAACLSFLGQSSKGTGRKMGQLLLVRCMNYFPSVLLCSCEI